MRVHELKCWPEPFAAVCRGEKTFEVRVDDDRGLGAVVYDHSHKLGQDAVTKLSEAQAYLESLAIKEVEAAIEPWMRDALTPKKTT